MAKPKLSLIRLSNFSGACASIYSVFLEHRGKTLFDIFLEENSKSYYKELEDIIMRLVSIGKRAGANIDFFKPFEGSKGDMVYALYDSPDQYLRLYCIRLSEKVIIIGGGGKKEVAKVQQDFKLTNENYLMREVSQEIVNARALKSMWISYNEMFIEGDLVLKNINDEYIP